MKKYRGLSSIKSRYGRMFAILWEIGIVFFVLIPMIQSIAYAFSDVKVSDSGMEKSFIGLGNFAYILKKDAYFVDYMTQSLSKSNISICLFNSITLQNYTFPITMPNKTFKTNR